MLLLLALGLLVRIVLAPWTEQRFDTYVNRLWCSLIQGYNLYPFEPSMPPEYPLTLRYSFPPIWLYILLTLFPAWVRITGYTFPANPASLWSHGIVVGNVFESYRSFVPPALPLLDLLFKVPVLLADVGIGYVLYKFARDSGREKTVLALWLFNPYTIQISAVWGLFDPLCAFFALSSIYLLWKGRFFLSATFLALGAATKMYPAFFLIPVVVYVWKVKGLAASVRYLLSGLVVLGVVVSSFLVFPGGLDFLYRLFIFKASPDWYGGNLISGLTWMRLLNFVSWEGNLPLFPLIFLPAFVGVSYGFWKAQDRLENAQDRFDVLIVCLVSVVLILYLSYTVVNPQYVFWILPFLLYLGVKRTISMRLYAVFSIIPLVYMYGAYNPLQFISPVLVWEEHNSPPWSDFIQQLWPMIFHDVTLLLIAVLLSIVSLFSVLYFRRSMNRGFLRR